MLRHGIDIFVMLAAELKARSRDQRTSLLHCQLARIR
jgi:hypothetical protein